MDPGVQASDMRLNLVSNSSMPSQVFLGRETGWLHIVWLHHPHNTNISIGNNTDALRDFEGQLVELSQRIVQVSVIGQFGNYHHKYGWKTTTSKRLSARKTMENLWHMENGCRKNPGLLPQTNRQFHQMLLPRFKLLSQLRRVCTWVVPYQWNRLKYHVDMQQSATQNVKSIVRSSSCQTGAFSGCLAPIFNSNPSCGPESGARFAVNSLKYVVCEALNFHSSPCGCDWKLDRVW
jgi:hypothetical protein